jgi:hypothetical protein
VTRGEPPLPVTITEYDPATVALKLQLEVSVPPAIKVTLVQEAVRPVAGVGAVEKLTVPAKLLRLLTDIVSVPEDPIVNVTVVEAGVRLKSATALTLIGSQELVLPLLLASPE